MRQHSHGAAHWPATVAPSPRLRTAKSSSPTTTQPDRQPHSPLGHLPQLAAPVPACCFCRQSSPPFDFLSGTLRTASFTTSARCSSFAPPPTIARTTGRAEFFKKISTSRKTAFITTGKQPFKVTFSLWYLCLGLEEPTHAPRTRRAAARTPAASPRASSLDSPTLG